MSVNKLINNIITRYSLKYYFKYYLERLTKKFPRKNDVDLGPVKLFYFKLSNTTENLGDYLSKVVVSHFVPKNARKSSKKQKTLYSIGSIIGFRCQNAVIWGSGILTKSDTIQKNVKDSNLKICAVRGPKTRQLLLEWGKDCPEIYGDPAILMPMIYKPEDTKKKYKVSLVFNYEHDKFEIPKDKDIHIIDIKTDNYKKFIDEIVQSSLVISSSLHGIILAETYGIPAITLLKKEAIFFKFEDWYQSTKRNDIFIARNIEEALSANPMPLPDLTEMQNNLLKAFPSELWQ